MYRVPPDRAWWPAVGAPLERGVRHHSAAPDDSLDFACAAFCYPLRAWARAVAVPRVCGAHEGLCMSLCALQHGPPHLTYGLDFIDAISARRRLEYWPTRKSDASHEEQSVGLARRLQSNSSVRSARVLGPSSSSLAGECHQARWRAPTCKLTESCGLAVARLFSSRRRR